MGDALSRFATGLAPALWLLAPMHSISHRSILVDSSGAKLDEPTVRADTKGHDKAICWVRERITDTDAVWAEPSGGCRSDFEDRGCTGCISTGGGELLGDERRGVPTKFCPRTFSRSHLEPRRGGIAGAIITAGRGSANRSQVVADTLAPPMGLPACFAGYALESCDMVGPFSAGQFRQVGIVAAQPRHAVHLLTEDVRMSSMPSCLGDHVHQDVVECHLLVRLGPPRDPADGVQVQRLDGVVRVGPGVAVQTDDLVD